MLPALVIFLVAQICQKAKFLGMFIQNYNSNVEYPILNPYSISKSYFLTQNQSLRNPIPIKSTYLLR